MNMERKQILQLCGQIICEFSALQCFPSFVLSLRPRSLASPIHLNANELASPSYVTRRFAGGWADGGGRKPRKRGSKPHFYRRKRAICALTAVRTVSLRSEPRVSSGARVATPPLDKKGGDRSLNEPEPTFWNVVNAI